MLSIGKLKNVYLNLPVEAGGVHNLIKIVMSFY
jgi:hypothetical protein